MNIETRTRLKLKAQDAIRTGNLPLFAPLGVLQLIEEIERLEAIFKSTVPARIIADDGTVIMADQT